MNDGKTVRNFGGYPAWRELQECETLIDGHFLDSLSIIALVAELEDEYDITIPAVEIIPANFNSAKAMWKMIQRLEEVD